MKEALVRLAEMQIENSQKTHDFLSQAIEELKGL